MHDLQVQEWAIQFELIKLIVVWYAMIQIWQGNVNDMNKATSLMLVTQNSKNNVILTNTSRKSNNQMCAVWITV